MEPIATLIDVEQGSDEWLELRLGLATASEFKSVLAKGRGREESAARRNYRVQVALERITHKQADRYKSRAMQHGNDTEDLAAMEYMLETENVGEKCGIFIHDKRPIGDSPDLLIGTDGCGEIKCYESANHLACMRTGKMPSQHMAQVQGHMWMANRLWCDFISFDPAFPEGARLFIQRIMRDQPYIDNLDRELQVFEAEVQADINFITNYKGVSIEQS